MIGMVTGFIKNFFWIGFTLVEALVFYLVAPVVIGMVTAWGYILPFTHLSYWEIFSGFIIITFLGQFINKLTPKIVNVNTKQENENKYEK